MKKIDSSLRFYCEVLKLDRLHYGLWDEADGISFEGLRKAQKRYEDYLVNTITEFLPEPETSLILDAGCGAGEMVKTLIRKGFKAEGLSPDPYQEELFRGKTGAKFHLSAFQDFEPEERYALIAMSESAQYIPLPGLFTKAANCLCENGFLVVSDYFVKDGAEGPQAKSGHNLGKFLSLAEKNNFTLKREEDITDRTAPTLELAMKTAEDYIIPSADILTERLKRKYPFIFGLLKPLAGKRLAKIKEDFAVIDSEEFKKNKRYMLFVFQK
jgi:SAM-dependent methyltransferase